MALQRIEKKRSVPRILRRLVAGEKPRRNELHALLSLTDPAEVEQLYAAARMVREKHFGSSVFLYGFLYFSTHCRNDCSFCQFRRSNIALRRYRKDKNEILEAAAKMATTGVHAIDLTMGEDPAFFNGHDSIDSLAEIVREVKKTTALPVMISPGVLSDTAIRKIAQKGADWYACYQETHNREHFQELRGRQKYDDRMAAKRSAKHEGMLVEEGILLGTGETVNDIVNSLYSCITEDADQVRAMTFVPQQGITINKVSSHAAAIETQTIAVMRLLMPDRLIPASLDIDGLDGLAVRLNAGANVITSLVPPEQGLAGVVNKSLDIEESRRTVELVKPVIRKCGLETGTQREYNQFLEWRKHICRPDFTSRENLLTASLESAKFCGNKCAGTGTCENLLT